MPEVNLEISFEVVWIKEDGDCSICIGCGDMIFGNKYSVGIKSSLQKDVSVQMTNICESCADEIK